MKQIDLKEVVSNSVDVASIFSNYVKKRSIFKNKFALSSSFIPDKIPHRDYQISQLANIMAPSLKGYQPSNVFIYGTVGTGKSITVRYVLSELRRMAQQLGVDVRTIYINCKMKKVADTEYRMLSQILFDLGIKVPDTGLPTDVLYKKMFEVIDETPKIIILALDEIDHLVKKVGDEFLYNLTRINTDLENSKITIIGITNDISFRERLDPRVKSSLSEEEMIFPPYNANQLRDILMERVGLAFNEGVVPESVINKCAAMAAQEHGDARRALDLLRVAGEVAERMNESTVREEHVDIAEKKLDMDRMVEIVKNQPVQSQMLFYAILLLKKGFTGDVVELYKKICRANGYPVLTHRRLSDLITELDMLGLISSRVLSKGRYGRMREIVLETTPEINAKLRKFLSEKFGDVDGQV